MASPRHLKTGAAEGGEDHSSAEPGGLWEENDLSEGTGDPGFFSARARGSWGPPVMLVGL